jgi:hypothetical protein
MPVAFIKQPAMQFRQSEAAKLLRKSLVPLEFLQSSLMPTTPAREVGEAIASVKKHSTKDIRKSLHKRPKTGCWSLGGCEVLGCRNETALISSVSQRVMMMTTQIEMGNVMKVRNHAADVWFIGASRVWRSGVKGKTNLVPNRINSRLCT